VARFAVTPQRFVGHLGDVRTSHHHRNARLSHGICHPVSLPDHARHGPNTHEADVLFPDVFDQLPSAQPLRVTVYQEHLMTRRRERFQEEHPKMRHEVVGDFVVRVIEENIHLEFPF